MNTYQEQILKLLSEVERIINSYEQDLVWSKYDSIEEVNADLAKFKAKVIEGDKTAIREIGYAFASTSSFQEISISSGWGQEFLKIAALIDTALAEWK